MAIIKNYGDPSTYAVYYKAQLGDGIQGFHGPPIMYGSGLGCIFRGLLHMAIPLYRRDLEIAKLHLKTATWSIAKDNGWAYFRVIFK